MNTSFSNSGKHFERRVALSAAAYATKNLLHLEKVDPPMRVVGGGSARRVIMLANPFLDFIGTWTERGGRMLAIECKSLESGLLPAGRHSGLTDSQMHAMHQWHKAGAATALLYERTPMMQVTLFTWPMIEAAVIHKGMKSIRWDDGLAVNQGTGFVLIDFLEVMRTCFKYETTR